MQKNIRLLISAFILFIASATSVQAISKDLKAGDKDPESGKILKYWVAPMDPKYIRDTFGQSPMGMDLVPVFQDEGGEKEPTSTIRIDPVTLQNMGVRLGTVSEKPVEKTIRAYGVITYDETKRYKVNLKYSGWVEKVYDNYSGVMVEAGDPLFEIYSPELVKAQEEYLMAYEQLKSLKRRGISSVNNGAAALMRSAEKRLERWDMNPQQIQTLRKEGKVQKTIAIQAPRPGVIVKKQIVEGDYITPGKWQYEIADLSTVWAEAKIYEYEIPWIKQGMNARMELSYSAEQSFLGTVMTVDPFVDSKTRSIRLRLKFDNPKLQLKPQMYVNVILESRLDDSGLVIPQEAVIDSGMRKVVFVSKGKGRFEPRDVVLGPEVNNGEFQLLEGLSKGDEIVLSAQFMFDSESRLREAINKLLKAREGGQQDELDDLNFDDMEMEMEMDNSETEDLKLARNKG